MDRYELTFSNDESFKQYEKHTKKMLEVLIVNQGVLPVELLKKIGMTKEDKKDKIWSY